MPGMFPQPVGYQSLQLRGDYLLAPRTVRHHRAQRHRAALCAGRQGSVTLNAKARRRAWSLNGAFPPCRCAAAALLAAAGGAGRARLDRRQYLRRHDRAARGSRPISRPACWTRTFARRCAEADLRHDNIEGNYVTGLTHPPAWRHRHPDRRHLHGRFHRRPHRHSRSCSGGHALIPNLHQQGTVGQFSVHVDGAMPDMMTLIDMKPLSYPTRFGIDPKTDQRARPAPISMFKVPMLADLPVDDVGISVKAQVSDFAVTLGKTAADQWRRSISTSTTTICTRSARSTWRIRASNVDWTEDFRTTEPVTTRLAVKGLMTEAARAGAQYRPAAHPAGTVPVSADITGHRGSLTHADVTVDLTPATSVGAHRQSGQDAGPGGGRARRRSISRPAMWCRTKPSASPARC